MASMKNVDWVINLPRGWSTLAYKMIKECETIDPTYCIYDLKEKWGTLDVIASCDMTYWREIDMIENKYEELSAKTCCSCGQPAVKYSTGWILPWCDKCGTEDEKFYKRFK